MQYIRFFQVSDDKRGFTLVELLIVIAIVILLLIFVFINLRGQAARATDIKRKTDLYNIRKSFEDYNNDHNAFPEASIVNTCGGAALAPYLAKVPCDPVSKLPYGYFPSVNGGYRICAKLSDTTDPAISVMGCGGPLGCGVGGGFNYCLTSGVSASAVGTVDQVVPVNTPTPTPTPSPTPIPPGFACAPGGLCNHYGNPSASGCPKTFIVSNCNNECSNPATWCAQ